MYHIAESENFRMSAYSYHLEREGFCGQQPQSVDVPKNAMAQKEEPKVEGASWLKLRNCSLKIEAERLGIRVSQLNEFLNLTYPELQNVTLDTWIKRRLQSNAVFKLLDNKDLKSFLASLWPYIHIQNTAKPQTYTNFENFQSDEVRYEEGIRCLKSLQKGPKDNGFFSKNIYKLKDTTHLPIRSFIFDLRNIITKIENAPTHLISDNVDPNMGMDVHLKVITKEEAKRNAKNWMRHKF
ncbi:MAG TPA: hypothetical protein VF185_01215 [Patescibacteria group bacterium]